MLEDVKRKFMYKNLGHYNYNIISKTFLYCVWIEEWSLKIWTIEYVRIWEKIWTKWMCLNWKIC